MGTGNAGDRERVFVAFIARRHQFSFGERAVRAKWLVMESEAFDLSHSHPNKDLDGSALDGKS
jgi:hypothetical protein